MESSNMNKILYGLEPRKTGEKQGTSRKIVVDSYVPEASGISLAETITSAYPCHFVTKRSI